MFSAAFLCVPFDLRFCFLKLTNRVCYNSPVMIDTFLVPEKTVVTAKGDGPVLDVSGAANRTLLLTLQITGIIEQESIDVTVYGSADGATWSAKPLLKFPQKFYHGDHPALVDLSAHKDV